MEHKLVTFGCSYTQGIGLEEHITSYSQRGTTSQYAWPQLLANQLQYKCENHSQGGIAPNTVMTFMREQTFNPTDIVVIQWPDFARRGFFSSADMRLDIGPHHEEYEEYYKHYYSDYDALLQFSFYVSYVEKIIKPQVAQLIQCSLFSEFELAAINYQPEWQYLVHDYVSADERDIVEQCEHDDHPHRKYHVTFADRLYKRLTNPLT